eukprot:353662_1
MLDFLNRHVIPRGDHAGFVQPAIEVDANLAASMIINNLKITNVTVLLHHLEEFYDDFGAWTAENLSLAPTFCICNGLQAVRKCTHTHHFACLCLPRGFFSTP